jgi:UDP-N-acetylglucosamine diphosphorylase/glucosamine-1-phosphate N-acetyltransferase
MNVCIFEDEGFKNLLPLTYTRPVFELRCGIFTLREKIQRLFPDSPVTVLCRDSLAEVVREENSAVNVNTLVDDDHILINGRALIDGQWLAKIDLTKEGIYCQEKEIVVAVVRKEGLEILRRKIGQPLTTEDFGHLNKFPATATLLNYPWDLIHHNSDQITSDFELLESAGVIDGQIYPHVSLIERKNIFIAQGASVKSGSVLDAEIGPIAISQGAKIFPNATIIGPAFVGENSLIKAGAKIYEGTSIGEYSKIGGEVEESIIHSYSNKQHDGFLGHSYLGQWINLGADTNNSDLKNNYGSVKVQLYGRTIDTHSQFVGAMIGDHAKTSINSMLNTGTVIGPFSNVFGGGFPPKYIPAFSWGGSDGLEEYDFDKAMETAGRVMKRRNKDLSPPLFALYRSIFEMTQPERTSR